MATLRGAYGGGEIKGSLGGITFQGSPFGTTIRTRTVPVNPNTPAQVAARSGFANASARWSLTLTAAQRQGWEDYASETPIPDRFGELRTVGGRRMYLRFNAAATILGASFIDTAPATPGVAPAATLVLAGDTTDGIRATGWDIEPPAISIVLVRQGLPVSQARNFYKSPFVTNQLVFPTVIFPVVLVPPAGVAVGQRWFFASRVFQGDAKVSFRTIQRVDILT